MREVLFCVLVLAVQGTGIAQSTSPDSDFERGTVTGNAYTNPALGISWELPKDWTVQTKGPSLLGDDYHLILRALPKGTGSEEFIEFTHSTDSGSVPVKSLLADKGWESSGKTGYYTLGGGIPAHRNDYTFKREPLLYMALLDGQHHGNVNLVIVADSLSRAEEVMKIVLQMKIQPDWGNAEEPLALVPSGSPPQRVRVSQGVSQALLEHKVQPTYPDSARKQHMSGIVIMLAHISTQGAIKNLFVLQGQPPLSQAALDAVSQWRYRPYLLQGNPVEVETQISIQFSLP